VTQCFGDGDALAAWEREADAQHRAHKQRIHGVRDGIERLVKVLRDVNRDVCGSSG